jgi:diadenosine tetraphosphate (Ap4A) HIT family hydrolase
MAEDYSKFLIKDYKYWEVQIFKNQGYLGRCVVWCKREGAEDLSEATLEEQKELFVVLREIKMAIEKTFKPDWFNYAFLGNETKHLHGHLVPRYASTREFMGVTFVDKLWGHNFQTDKDFKISDEVFSKIKEKIKEAL